MNPIDKPTYDYLHSLLDAATKHFDECDDDLLDCDCGKQIDGDVLIDLMLGAMRELRDGGPWRP